MTRDHTRAPVRQRGLRIAGSSQGSVPSTRRGGRPSGATGNWSGGASGAHRGRPSPDRGGGGTPPVHAGRLGAAGRARRRRHGGRRPSARSLSRPVPLARRPHSPPPHLVGFLDRPTLTTASFSMPTRVSGIAGPWTGCRTPARKRENERMVRSLGRQPKKRSAGVTSRDVSVAGRGPGRPDRQLRPKGARTYAAAQRVEEEGGNHLYTSRRVEPRHQVPLGTPFGGPTL